MTFLGIDGGGSKTTFLLEDQQGRTLTELESGPSNWLSAGPEQSRQSLAEGLSQLPSVPDVVCGGFAGAGRPEGVDFYRQCLTALLPASRIFIETDAFITYIGALGVRPGVLLIAGTGSIALARRAEGQMLRAGGWGPEFSDEGGGFWIGREAVRSALHARDSGASPDFVEEIARTLGLQNIADVPAAWKSGGVTVRSVASLAPILMAQYPAEPARRILTEAAAHLRALTERASLQAGFAPSCLKSAAGSIAAQPLMLELIGLDFTAPQNPPARGAILWARDRILPR